MQTWWLHNAGATREHAAAWSMRIRLPCTVFLSGEQGAGKTSWVRGLLHALGHDGPVKSPSYSLVESYLLALGDVVHIDLYRLETTAELAAIGMEDYLDARGLCLVEWPERITDRILVPDWHLHFTYQGCGRALSMLGNRPAPSLPCDQSVLVSTSG